MSDVHRPTFSDTREEPWSKPALEDFVQANGWAADTWDELTENQQETVANNFLWTRTEFLPDTFGDLVGPVVDAEKTLVLSALANAKARAGQIEGVAQSDIEEGVEIINDLANSNFEDANFEEEQEMSEEEQEEKQEPEEQGGERVEVRTAAERMIEQRKGEGGIERVQTDQFELRAEDDKDLSGHPAVFNQPHNLLEMKEVFRPGSFKKTISEGNIAALLNHDTNMILARLHSDGGGTLNLTEDNRGLHMEIPELPHSMPGKLTREAVKREDIQGGSIGMIVHRDNIEENEEGELLREIKEVELRDVGPVTFPASGSTSVEARSDAGIIERANQIVDFNVYKFLSSITRSDGELAERDEEQIRSAINHLKSLTESDTKHNSEVREKLEKVEKRLKQV